MLLPEMKVLSKLSSQSQPKRGIELRVATIQDEVAVCCSYGFDGVMMVVQCLVFVLCCAAWAASRLFVACVPMKEDSVGDVCNMNTAAQQGAVGEYLFDGVLMDGAGSLWWWFEIPLKLMGTELKNEPLTYIPLNTYSCPPLIFKKVSLSYLLTKYPELGQH